jgi:tetratricopeptide (TPR) repeat protein
MPTHRDTADEYGTAPSRYFGTLTALDVVSEAERLNREGSHLEGARALDEAIRKGWDLLWKGEAGEALACAERVLTINRGSSAAHTLRGDSLMVLSRWAEAFKAFEAAACAPGLFGASDWASRGDEFRSHQQLDLALQAYEHAIEKDPNNPAGWHGKGILLKESNNVDAALKHFEHASKLDREFIAGYLDAGVLCTLRGEYESALGFFERANEAQPDDGRPWKFIGWLEVRRGRYAEALKAYQLATTVDPNDGEAWNLLGNVFVHVAKFEDALISYQQAIETDPEAAWPYHNLAYAHWLKGNFGDAHRFIEQAIARDPANGTFSVQRLIILNSANRISNAEILSIAEATLPLISNNPDLMGIVASILAENDLMDRAREIINGIAETTIDDPKTLLGHAENLLQIGESRAAAAVLENSNMNRLKTGLGVIRSFLRLVAERLNGSTSLSEELFIDFVNTLKSWIEQVEHVGNKWRSLKDDWDFAAMRRILKSDEFRLTEKLILSTLIDLQEANIHPDNLSFLRTSASN